jgi:polyphosphate glucokinase
MTDTNASTCTLSIDIGGSGIKVIVLDEKGNPLGERVRLDTPQPPTPEAVMNTIKQLITSVGEFDRISAGFPGVVRAGVVETAVNLHPDWVGYNFADALSKHLQKPARVINDADMQGLGAIAGKGVELVITLGTGFGSALFLDGKLVPNLEMGHHRFRKRETYEEQLGRAALEKIGEAKWNERLAKAIASLEHLFNYDYLYIGGGEAKFVKLKLRKNVQIISNLNGLLGGIALWRN